MEEGVLYKTPWSKNPAGQAGTYRNVERIVLAVLMVPEHEWPSKYVVNGNVNGIPAV